MPSLFRHRAATRAAVASCLLASLMLLAGCASTGVETASTPLPTNAARTKAVESPNGGSTDDVVKDAPPQEQVKADLDKVARIHDDVEISASTIKAITAKAQTPGDMSGPGLAVTISIQNHSQTTLDVNTVVVTLLDSAGAAGIPTASDPTRPFTGTIAAGDGAEGVYVFIVPEGTRDRIELTVAYSAGVPVALFTGPASH
jgi:hypothetical protein